MELTIYTDGASRGNPGLASYGFVIYDHVGDILYEQGEYIGINTNNFAEYTAVIEAMKKVRENIKSLLKNSNDQIIIKFFADSKLVVEQLSGRYKIKSENLKPLVVEIKNLEKNFVKVTYQHVPREKNKIADKLANQALDRL